MKKVLTLMLLLSIAPAAVADDCCPSSDCCQISCETNCQPSGCCVEDCDDLDPCDCRVSSHSFFSVRPHFQGASPEKIAHWRLDRMYERIEGYHGTFQIVPFGGRSGKSRRMATYFTPFCRAEFTVAEDLDVASNNQNPEGFIDARAFNIVTANGDFKSNICFRPQQSTAGVGLSWRQKPSRHDEEKGFWFEASMPITHVRNKMGFEETVAEDGGGVNANISTAQPNMTTAFQQAAFNAGRIPCDCNDGLTKTGVADLDVRLGYGWRQHDICHLESYVGILAPTGNSVEGRNLFEPIIGNNKHVGFEFGSAAGYRVWSNEEKGREAWVETAVHSVYRNKKTQRRSFDLKYSPWSRYLPMYASFEQANKAFNDSDATLGVAGINVLTDDVRVHGRFQRTYNTAVVFHSPRFSAELGYNFFCRDAECIELCNWCGAGAAIKHCQAQGDEAYYGTTNRFRRINACNDECDNAEAQREDLEAGYNANKLSEDDLDLNSAAAPGMTQHTFYANLGYRWDDLNYPTFVSLGGSYEFASDNTGMNRWLVWGKIGISY